MLKKIGVVFLLVLSACSAQKVEPSDIEKAVIKGITALDKRDTLIIQAFKEIDARIRVIEGKLKITSPALPEEKKNEEPK